MQKKDVSGFGVNARIWLNPELTVAEKMLLNGMEDFTPDAIDEVEQEIARLKRLHRAQTAVHSRYRYNVLIPAPVRFDKGLTPNAKLLYGELAVLSRGRGYTDITNGQLADLYGVSKAAISKWIKNLAQHGYVDVRRVYENGSSGAETRLLYIKQGWM